MHFFATVMSMRMGYLWDRFVETNPMIHFVCVQKSGVLACESRRSFSKRGCCFRLSLLFPEEKRQQKIRLLSRATEMSTSHSSETVIVMKNVVVTWVFGDISVSFSVFGSDRFDRSSSSSFIEKELDACYQ